MRTRSKTFLLLLIMLMLNYLPHQLIQSATLVETLYSIPNSTPKIDGILTNSEWQDAKEIKITLYDTINMSRTLDLSLKSTYNLTEGTISFGATFNRTDSSALIFIFKTNTSDAIINKYTFWELGKNHDVKWVSGWNNNSYDTFSEYFFLPLMNYDEDLGGTNDTQGKCHITSEQYSVELTTPLNSGDELGYDIDLVENSQIEFIIIYFDGRLTFSPLRIEDNDYDYYILFVGEESSVGIGSFFIIGSFIVSIVIITILTRKNDNK